MFKYLGNWFLVEHCTLERSQFGVLYVTCNKHGVKESFSPAEQRESQTYLPTCCYSGLILCDYCHTEISESAWLNSLSICGDCSIRKGAEISDKVKKIRSKQEADDLPIDTYEKDMAMGLLDTVFHYAMYESRMKEPFDEDVEDLPKDVKQKLYEPDSSSFMLRKCLSWGFHGRQHWSPSGMSI